MTCQHHAALQEFERHLQRRGLSPRTCEVYLAVATRFLAFARRTLGKLRRRDVTAFLAARSRKLAPLVHRHQAYFLRVFLRWLADERLAAHDLADVVPASEGHRPEPLLLSRQAVADLLATASQPGRWGRVAALRDRALLELAYGLGLRASELRAALVVDLDLAQGTLRVRRAKRGEHRVLPLPPSALPHLDAYLTEARPALARRSRGRDRGHLLLTNAGTPLRHDAGVQDVVRRVAERAGRRAHPHAIRRALANHLLGEGVNVLAVQELLGHRHLDTTARYLAEDHQQLRRAVEALDRVAQGARENQHRDRAPRVGARRRVVGRVRVPRERIGG